ncbi:hypothetical protein [Phascolarctobacterium sp.]|uniref:hypothetical protein n=1 Tax=Phascolarctobacterium sp. TaxID=2049039 RepID=UPI0038633FDE
MRKLKSLLVVLILICSMVCAACSSSTAKANAVPNFKLYHTKNMWNFLKLETSTGKIWQVQYAINNDDARMECPLNNIEMVESSGQRPGRFELYECQNMYTFLLVDTVDGRVWQIQWSTEPANRGVVAQIK